MRKVKGNSAVNSTNRSIVKKHFARDSAYEKFQEGSPRAPGPENSAPSCHGDESVTNFMANKYPPGFTYQDFAPYFEANSFSPKSFADLFYKAGAKYVILTSKHYDGFTLFPSKHSPGWNSVEAGPKRDLVGELANSIRRKGMKFGVYYSLFEWFNPIFLHDMQKEFQSRNYVNNKMRPEIEQLIRDYKPSVLWADGDWPAYDIYWNSTALIAGLYNDSPVKHEVVVNDRWGRGTTCTHGDFYNCKKKYNPGYLTDHKWENVFSMDRQAWGCRRDRKARDVLTTRDLIKEVVTSVSLGGNVLISVPPTLEGTIEKVFQDRLLGLGAWLRVNGEAVYGTSPWRHQNDIIANDVWYTCTKTNYDAKHPVRKPHDSEKIISIYAIFLTWPPDNTIRLRYIPHYFLTEAFEIQLLGYNGKLKWNTTVKPSHLAIELPPKVHLRTDHAWSIKFNLTTDVIAINTNVPIKQNVELKAFNSVNLRVSKAGILTIIPPPLRGLKRVNKIKWTWDFYLSVVTLVHTHCVAL
ncbi:tissue alpha-L-fucosidase-like isoform X2 [Plodia interpunctella]|uniref:tissue alpha-L-fucosidase-like isoform X2 n=1 Tax=Plodia interpunctella TaxID=58824 RepID=UPI002368238C|nr:tissue alpha-L-fucosidase-like isoform X3 [Plodia interpunctella]